MPAAKAWLSGLAALAALQAGCGCQDGEQERACAEKFAQAMASAGERKRPRADPIDLAQLPGELQPPGARITATRAVTEDQLPGVHYTMRSDAGTAELTDWYASSLAAWRALPQEQPGSQAMSFASPDGRSVARIALSTHEGGTSIDCWYAVNARLGQHKAQQQPQEPAARQAR